MDGGGALRPKTRPAEPQLKLNLFTCRSDNILIIFKSSSGEFPGLSSGIVRRNHCGDNDLILSRRQSDEKRFIQKTGNGDGRCTDSHRYLGIWF
jgi:hypothetical protein